jgi:hypothetical protein
MRVLGLLLLLLLPMQAAALSCLRPSVERTFAEASAAADVYVIVEGRLTLDTRKLPKAGPGQQKAPKMTRVAARLNGRSLSKDGFRVPFNQKINLEVACFGPWCGAAQNGDEVLAFLRRDGAAYSLAINPCGGFVFPNPKPSMLKQVQGCFQRGSC